MLKNQVFAAVAGVALLGSISLGLSACDNNGNPKVTQSLNTKLSPANIAKLSKGMNRTQVEALFGPPTTVGDVKDFAIFKKQQVTYVEGKESLSITYKNDEVEDFNSTVGSTTTTATSDGQTKSTTTTTTKSDN